jgi:hypothetical protein
MKRFLITAAVGLCMFVLGLAAASQPKPGGAPNSRGTVGDLTWQRDAKNLTVTNRSKGASYFVMGVPKKAGEKVTLTYTTRQVKVPLTDLNKVFVLRIEEVLECDPRQCRRCNEGLCPIPPPPPEPIFYWVQGRP